MIRIPMTRQQFETRSGEVTEKLGIKPEYPPLQDNGTLIHSGVQAKYSFDGSALTVTVEKHPFFVTEQYVEGQITAWFAGGAS